MTSFFPSDFTSSAHEESEGKTNDRHTEQNTEIAPINAINEDEDNYNLLQDDILRRSQLSSSESSEAFWAMVPYGRHSAIHHLIYALQR